MDNIIVKLPGGDDIHVEYKNRNGREYIGLAQTYMDNQINVIVVNKAQVKDLIEALQELTKAE